MELLEEKGSIPPELQQKIQSEKEMNILKSWFKLATKVDSISEFISKM